MRKKRKSRRPNGLPSRFRADGRLPVIELIPRQINTRRRLAEVPQKDGFFTAGDGYLKAAVLERHHATGRVGLGAVYGLGLRGNSRLHRGA